MPENQEMISIGKVTINIGVGEPGEELEKAKKLLERLTDSKAVKTKGKKNIPLWDVREGKVLGVKTTLRGKTAEKFLERAFEAIENQVKKKNFDERGNLNFGVEEYIEMPGIEYDPKIGMFGLNVSITMNKWGYRVKKRKINPSKIPKKHFITKEESIKYLTDKFNLEVTE